jgi:putative transposase
MKFAFIADHREEYPITTMCRVLGVSTSGFYAWQGRPVCEHQQANARLLADIQAIHIRSRQTYGSPRIHAELRARGIVCSRGRVARLMRLNGVVARRRKRYKVTTKVDARLPVGPNLLARDFTADRPNVKWLADITYIDTYEGWSYLAAVMDVYSRRIVGWSMHTRMATDLVEDALRMALGQREHDDALLHHSDRGSQYTSGHYQTLLAQAQITSSMSGIGNCYDNAMMGSLFATLNGLAMFTASSRGILSAAEHTHQVFCYRTVFSGYALRSAPVVYEVLSPTCEPLVFRHRP